MKKQLPNVTFFLIAVFACALDVFFVSRVDAQVQGACVAAPCDCTSVGGIRHPVEA